MLLKTFIYSLNIYIFLIYCTKYLKNVILQIKSSLAINLIVKEYLNILKALILKQFSIESIFWNFLDALISFQRSLLFIYPLQPAVPSYIFFKLYTGSCDPCLYLCLFVYMHF